jgi:hypothetical protein
MTTYKNYNIEKDSQYFNNEFRFYPKEERNDSKWADSIEEAKDSIDETIMKQTEPYLVETIIYKGSFRLRNITKFDWISDAIKFAVRFDGKPLFEINSI